MIHISHISDAKRLKKSKKFHFSTLHVHCPSVHCRRNTADCRGFKFSRVRKSATQFSVLSSPVWLHVTTQTNEDNQFCLKI